MNGLAERAAGLQTTVAGMAGEIRDRQVRRQTLYVRALDHAAVRLNELDPSASIEEHRSWALGMASTSARGAVKATAKEA